MALGLLALPVVGRAEIALYDGLDPGPPEAQAWLTYAELPPPLDICYATGSGKTDLDTRTTTNRNCIQAGWHNYNLTLSNLKNPAFPALDRTAGFVVGIDVRVIDESHGNANRAGFSLIALGSDTQGIEIAFWTDRVWAQNVDFSHGEEALFDTTAAIRHYELTVQGNNYALSLGGSPLLAGVLRNYSGFGAPYDRPSFVFLGDDTTSAQGESEFTLVTIAAGLAMGDAAVAEGNAGMLLSFPVALALAHPGTVTVSYATEAGTARPQADYVAGSGTLTFGPGDTSRTIDVPLVGDTLSEADETMFVRLSASSGAPIDRALGQGTILDDDPLPSLSVFGATVREGRTGTHLANVRVSLSARSGQTVTVGYTLGGGTATAGSDYVDTPGIVTFPPFVLTRFIRVPIQGDAVPEGNEAFFVTLGGASGATVSSGLARVTIRNDDR